MVIETSFPGLPVTVPKPLHTFAILVPFLIPGSSIPIVVFVNGTTGVVQCTTCTAVPDSPNLSWVSLLPTPFSVLQLLSQRSELGGDPRRQIKVPVHSPSTTFGSDS